MLDDSTRSEIESRIIDEIATTAKIRQYFQAAVEANDSDL